MTRKDYELIAGAFLQCGDGDKLTLSRVAHTLANGLKNDNSAFDEKRFLSACGVTSAKTGANTGADRRRAG